MRSIRNSGLVLPLLAAALAFASGCTSNTMSAHRNGDAETHIRASADSFMAAFNRGDAEGVANHYTDDALLIAPGGPPTRGREEIRRTLREFFAPGNAKLSFGPDQIEQPCDDFAYEIGHFELSAAPAGGGAPQTQKGHYLACWRKLPNGQWLMVADVTTLDPAPQ